MPAIGTLQHWHAHFLTIQRRQCVLFCENETRFIVFGCGLQKKDFAHLNETFETLLHHALAACCGSSSSTVKKVLKACGEVYFDNETNRSVLSTMRIAERDLKISLEYPSSDQKALIDTPYDELHSWLNHRPLTVKGQKDCIWADNEMSNRVKQILAID